MPVQTKQLETIVRLGLNEKDSTLVQINAYDGFGRATQIVRAWDDLSKGDPEVSMATILARLEQKVDAGETLTPGHELGEQGLGRYVANPYVGDAQFPGIWVGGPLQIGDDYDVRRGNRNRRLTQVLTLIHPVGHTFTVDSSGNVSASTPGTSADASIALSKLRPVFRTGGRDLEAFSDLFPPGDTVEIAWKYLSHESQEPILSMTPEEVKDAVNAFVEGDKDWKPTEWDFSIDENNNGGVFTVRAVCKQVNDADTVDELEDAPHYLEPAKRDTVRNWGNDSDGKGRGYFWTIVGKWKDLSPGNRLALLTSIDADALGARLLGTNPLWRCQKKEVVRQDDGLLGFDVTWTRPEHTNVNEKVNVAKSGQDGWGQSTSKLVPTVPYNQAESVMEGLEAPPNSVVDSKRSQETDQGYNDISLQTTQGWNYQTESLTPPNLPTYQGITAPVIEYRPDVCDGGGGFTATYRNVLPSSAAQLADRASGTVLPQGGGAVLKSVSIVQHENGLCDVSASSTTHKYFRQFGSILSSDYFTNVYRADYSGLTISPSGVVTDEHGTQITLKDALGNEIPTVNVSGGTILFKKGVSISVSYQRDAECRYHAAVTTEVAVARTWSFSYRTQRNGHSDLVTETVFRNWPTQPSVPAESHGTSNGYNFQINRFGLYDGQVETRSDFHEEHGLRESEDAFSSSRSESKFHQDAPVSGVSRKGVVESVDNRLSAPDGKYDTVKTTEASKRTETSLEYDTWNNGHRIHNKRVEVRNADSQGELSIDANHSGSLSASENRFQQYDLQKHQQDDLYVKTANEESEDRYSHTRSDTTNVSDSAKTHRGFVVGQIDTVANRNYTDGKHDVTEQTVTAKPYAFHYTWSHRYDKKKMDGVAPAYTYVFRNYEAEQTMRPPSGTDDYIYLESKSVELNRYGLYDTTYTFVPDTNPESNTRDKLVFYGTQTVTYQEVFDKRNNIGDGSNKPNITLSDTAPYWFRINNVTVKKSFHTTRSSAQAAADGGAPGSKVDGPHSSMLRQVMFTATKVTIETEQSAHGGWFNGPAVYSVSSQTGAQVISGS